MRLRPCAKFRSLPHGAPHPPSNFRFRFAAKGIGETCDHKCAVQQRRALRDDLREDALRTPGLVAQKQLFVGIQISEFRAHGINHDRGKVEVFGQPVPAREEMTSCKPTQSYLRLDGISHREKIRSEPRYSIVAPYSALRPSRHCIGRRACPRRARRRACQAEPKGSPSWTVPIAFPTLHSQTDGTGTKVQIW